MRPTFLVPLLALSACGGAAGFGLQPVPTSTCASGQQWTGAAEATQDMNPGQTCIACHASSGEGPHYVIAGTVYGAPNEANDCAGSSGVQVVITGADNQVITLTANTAGNFFTRQSVAMPYTAKIVFPGGERAMATPQSDGECNGCHTAQGANGAPGRIAVP